MYNPNPRKLPSGNLEAHHRLDQGAYTQELVSTAPSQYTTPSMMYAPVSMFKLAYPTAIYGHP